MQPLHMVSPASQDERRKTDFPNELIDYLAKLIDKNITPRYCDKRLYKEWDNCCDGGGSTNVMLHAPELARAAGYKDFYGDIMSHEEFNNLSQNVIPVVVNARPFGKYSMVDIDSMGGIQVIKDMIDSGLLNGDTLTCTSETLIEQVTRLKPIHQMGMLFIQ